MLSFPSLHSPAAIPSGRIARTCDRQAESLQAKCLHSCNTERVFFDVFGTLCGAWGARRGMLGSPKGQANQNRKEDRFLDNKQADCRGA